MLCCCWQGCLGGLLGLCLLQACGSLALEEVTPSGRAMPSTSTTAADSGAAITPQCLSGSEARAIHAPEPQALQISEVMANPAGADAQREWLELWVAGAQAVDLATLRLEALPVTGAARRPRQWRIAADLCRSVAPGSYNLIGLRQHTATFDAKALGLPLVAEALGYQQLPNDAMQLTLYAGTTLLDQVQLPASSTAVSWSRDLTDNTWHKACASHPCAMPASPGAPHAPPHGPVSETPP